MKTDKEFVKQFMPTLQFMAARGNLVQTDMVVNTRCG